MVGESSAIEGRVLRSSSRRVGPLVRSISVVPTRTNRKDSWVVHDLSTSKCRGRRTLSEALPTPPGMGAQYPPSDPRNLERLVELLSRPLAPDPVVPLVESLERSTASAADVESLVSSSCRLNNVVFDL